ncbi:MAG: hypothetical protein ND807_16515, partial [Vicinamibacterales bacterium]|nr:hypothetical protein [Vicinamibacterales bacterium]
MRRDLVLATSLVVAIASPARAQTPRDGIDALARGDYQATASVLNPLVESWPPAGPLPDFVMGALYENGIGVPADRLRA